MSSPPLYGPMGGSFPARQGMAGRRRFQGSQAQPGTQPQDPALQQPQSPQSSLAPQQQQQQPAQHHDWNGQQGPANQQQQGGQPRPQMTFAQMQQNGIARPAPPPQAAPQQQPQNPQSALSSSITQALQNPSAYNAPQVQQTFNMLNQQLGQQYDYQRKQLNDEMGARGLSESTIAGQRYSDLASEQALAQGNMATQLATQAAQTYGSDRTAAQQAGLGYGNLGVNQGQLGLASQLGLGNLGIAQGQLTGNYNGQQTLGSQQLGLQQALGYGGLGLQAGELTGNYGGQSTLGAQQLQQQGSQFSQSQNQQNQQFNTQQQLAQMLGLGNLGLQQQQVSNQANQFGQSFGLQSLQNQQQYGLQSQAAQLAQTLGLGNLGISQGQLGLAQLNNQQQYGLQSQAQQNQASQFQQQLAQALQTATMSDRTANRSVDAQASLANNDLMLKVASLLSGMGGYGASGSGTGGTGSAGSTSTSGWSWPTNGGSGSTTGSGGNGITDTSSNSFNPLGSSSFAAPNYAMNGSTMGTPIGQSYTGNQDQFGTFNFDTGQYDNYQPSVWQARDVENAINNGMSQQDAWQKFIPNASYNASDFSPATGGLDANGQPIQTVSMSTQQFNPQSLPQNLQGQPTGPASYVNNGLQVNGQGQAVQGGYNALSQNMQNMVGAGNTPGVFSPGMIQLMQSNPNLLYAMFPNVPRAQLDQFMKNMGVKTNTVAPNPYGS